MYLRSSWTKTATRDFHRLLLGCCYHPKESRPRPQCRLPVWMNCHPALGWWRFRTSSDADANWADGDSNPWPSAHRPLFHRWPPWPTRPSRIPVAVAAAVDFGIRVSTLGTACCTAAHSYTVVAACWICRWPPRMTVAVQAVPWKHHPYHNTRPWPVDHDSSQSQVSATRRIPGLERPACIQTDKTVHFNIFSYVRYIVLLCYYWTCIHIRMFVYSCVPGLRTEKNDFCFFRWKEIWNASRSTTNQHRRKWCITYRQF